MSARRESRGPARDAPLPVPVRVLFVVRDPRVRDMETLAEFDYGPDGVIPSVDSSVVIGELVWRVAHVRHFVEAARIEIWLVPLHSRLAGEMP